MSEKRYILGTNIERVEVDPVTLQVLGGAFRTISEEMGLVLYRMSYSSIIRESEDLGAGIVDRRARQIAESENSPMHAGTVGACIKGILSRWEEKDIHEGDIFIHNHPYHGASHSPDVEIIIPIFYKEELIAYSAINAHVSDVGAPSAGIAIKAQDVTAEARQFYALKLYENGERNEQLWRCILDNCRTPSMNANDYDALIAAAEHGRVRFLELIDKYGLEIVFSAEEEWFDYTERVLRAEISKAKDGVYYSESYLDDDGINLGVPLKIATTVTIKGDEITVDLTGSADEVYSACNVPFEGSTVPAINTIIHSLFLDADKFGEYVPQNEGLERPLHIIAPKGCLFNPNYPRACYARFNQVNRLADTIMNALADAMPMNVAAGCSADLHYFVYNGFDKKAKEYWLYAEVTEGSYGGRYGKDGMDTVDCLVANTRNMPIEESEWHYPLRIERYGLRPQPAAPGKWRGGIGVIRETTYLSDGFCGCEGDGHLNNPKGIFGGNTGKASTLVKNPGKDNEEILPSKFESIIMKAGDSIEVQSPNSGGYGNPLEREPDMVLSDILDGFATREQAENDYCVVIDYDNMTVDYEATMELRASKM
ncbi:hydantoinase B/oxoprolinase family protein [Eubacterium oxidoreducens]|uniref:N-methylhydantoinase B n=1 Tax=Eubacterium oxidoreducens TaxID=1732 RepID=A0A1G6C773_EUBOX|nr:hydantoinase B/oxoprolinase family protein [Eubacterium oxidoreducens]SDB28729.1 N-methylhydantoinase B [Eubacterium oxidoreducens]